MGISRTIATLLLPFFTWTAFHLLTDVESALVASCSFEKDLCSWSTPSWSDGNWTRSLGSDTDLTGPSAPKVGIGGLWFIALKSEGFKNQTAGAGVQAGKRVILLTPELPAIYCIAFLYMKHGDENIGDLTIGVAKDGAKRSNLLWTKTGKTENTWQCEAVSPVVENEAVYFEAVTSTVTGDIALDQIMLFDNKCPVNSDCLSLLNVSATSATTTSTSTVTPTPTHSDTQAHPTSSASSSSPTTFKGHSSSPTQPVTTVTEKAEEEEGDPFDTVVLLSVVIPLIVFAVAAVTAFIFYRRRREDSARIRRESAAQQHPPVGFVGDADEVYDVIEDPDVIIDHYDKITDVPNGLS